MFTKDNVPSWRFQVLFHSLFKVLLIFRSRYLCAIGLSQIFSFRWDLPPDSRSTTKERDSASREHALTHRLLPGRGSHPPWHNIPEDLGNSCPPVITLRETTIRYPFMDNDYQIELFPVRSPLLRESLLFSFPPLNDMLKFRGYSSITWCQKIIIFFFIQKNWIYILKY